MENNKPSNLRDFIKEQSDLITIASIFVALTLFSHEFITGLLGGVISLIFFGGFLLLWTELWSSFPKKRVTTKLGLFEEVIVFSGIALIIYWYAQLEFISQDMFIFAIALPIAASIMVCISGRIKKLHLFERWKIPNESPWRYIVGIILSSIFVIITLYTVEYIWNRYGHSANVTLESFISSTNSPDNQHP